MNDHQKAMTGYICAMLIFGTIGIFRRYMNLSSGVISLARGLAGGLFLFLLSSLRGKKKDTDGIKKNLPLLIVSGIAMGFNWILLFESYRFTTVAISTLCYYMQPVILILAAPLVLHEKLNVRNIAAVIVAVFGMALVTGVVGGTLPQGTHLKGILLGLGAAALYAVVVLINMKIKSLNSYDKTMTQLLIAGACMIPYLLLTHGFAGNVFDARSIILLIIVCIVHTGMAYALYFHSMEGLQSETVALLGYIDPITAVLLSALFLHESMTVLQMIGAVLVLGSAVVNELLSAKKNIAE